MSVGSVGSVCVLGEPWLELLADCLLLLLVASMALERGRSEDSACNSDCGKGLALAFGENRKGAFRAPK